MSLQLVVPDTQSLHPTVCCVGVQLAGAPLACLPLAVLAFVVASPCSVTSFWAITITNPDLLYLIALNINKSLLYLKSQRAAADGTLPSEIIIILPILKAGFKYIPTMSPG